MSHHDGTDTESETGPVYDGLEGIGTDVVSSETAAGNWTVAEARATHLAIERCDRLDHVVLASRTAPDGGRELYRAVLGSYGHGGDHPIVLDAETHFDAAAIGGAIERMIARSHDAVPPEGDA